MLDSIRALAEFVADRQTVISTLLANLGALSESVGGRSREFIQLLTWANRPVDAAMEVLDEFRKSALYGPQFTRTLVRLLHHLGIEPGASIDDGLDKAITNFDDTLDGFKMIPVVWENIEPPAPRGSDGLFARAGPTARNPRCVAGRSAGGAVQPLRAPGAQIALGAVAMMLIGVLAATATVMYLRPPGQTAVIFYTDDAATVHPGDPVRIAGVTVGRIKDLAIEPDQIRVRASVAADAFVGDRSQVQVRMRTVVGGYYTAITSLGDKPLGAQPIPRERVRMPYNLIRTVSEAAAVTDRVEPAPIRDVLDKLQRGLAGDNVEAVSALLEAGTGWPTRSNSNADSSPRSSPSPTSTSRL